MNTDQAYDLLITAGFSEDESIQTVRRWLRERKIKYAGKTVTVDQPYINEGRNNALLLLNELGISPTDGARVIQNWLNGGKRKKQNNPSDFSSFKNTGTAISHVQDKPIHELLAKIKGQEDHIKGLEDLHHSSIQALVQERDRLYKKIVNLKNELNITQEEASRILKENIVLRNELGQIKNEQTKEGKGGYQETQNDLPTKTSRHHQKLGLSKTASQREVLAAFKKLLKVSHPDHGGNAAVFHYIKSEYNHFKASLRE